MRHHPVHRYWADLHLENRAAEDGLGVRRILLAHDTCWQTQGHSARLEGSRLQWGYHGMLTTIHEPNRPASRASCGRCRPHSRTWLSTNWLAPRGGMYGASDSSKPIRRPL